MFEIEQNSKRFGFRNLDFGFVSDFEFRISSLECDFGFRYSDFEFVEGAVTVAGGSGALTRGAEPPFSSGTDPERTTGLHKGLRPDAARVVEPEGGLK
jgi:hypothetical protein